MGTDATVLFVSGDPAETMVFERILCEHMDMKRVRDLAELKAVLGNGNHYDAVLCGGSFRKCEWKDAMRYALQGSPDFPLIISRRIGTERKSVEVLGAGAFDLLPTPHVERSVLGLLEDAVASYEARRVKNVLPWCISLKQAGQERHGASISPRKLRGGTKRVFHLRQVPDTRVGI